MKKMAIVYKEMITVSISAARDNGLTEEDIRAVAIRLCGESRSLSRSLLLARYVHALLYRVMPIILLSSVLLAILLGVLKSDPCLLHQPLPLDDFAAPVSRCSHCHNTSNIVVLESVTTEEFMEKYAFSRRPVLVKGAASDWPALGLFSYSYFKELYLNRPEAIAHDVETGQFFPYSSGIKHLKDFLALSDDTAALKTDKWYIGWSTDDEYIGEELRKHVQEPYFLPPFSSDTHLAWIFMGAPGKGASLHIDYVGRPSWQAQLSGKKTWTFVPQPECEAYCHSFNATVHTGDIIVVDTNIWFHGTFVHEGNISITFGTEYS